MRAADFHSEKEVLMGSEVLLARYMSWKVEVAKAIDAKEMETLISTSPAVEQILEHCQSMLKDAPEKSPSRREIKKIVTGMKKLSKFVAYVRNHKDNINLLAMRDLLAAARKLARSVEISIFNIMTIEDSSIENRFDWSMRMQQDLVTALLVAAVVNSILLAAVCIFGLRIAERIADLKHKASDFAGGKRLEPSLSGKDELSYLDRRLCEVSQAIKDADSQRQKLIAIINHDLRTPLSSIINGLQMIIASGYGEIGEKEKALSTGAESEAKPPACADKRPVVD